MNDFQETLERAQSWSENPSKKIANPPGFRGKQTLAVLSYVLSVPMVIGSFFYIFAFSGWDYESEGKVVYAYLLLMLLIAIAMATFHLITRFRFSIEPYQPLPIFFMNHLLKQTSVAQIHQVTKIYPVELSTLEFKDPSLPTFLEEFLEKKNEDLYFVETELQEEAFKHHQHEQKWLAFLPKKSSEKLCEGDLLASCPGSFGSDVQAFNMSRAKIDPSSPKLLQLKRHHILLAREHLEELLWFCKHSRAKRGGTLIRSGGHFF